MSSECLLDESVTFEPVGNVTSVFFDDKSQQIFSVRSGGATGVIVRGFNDRQSSTFRLDDKGPIISIKLSPDQKVLSVQRTKTTVEFYDVVQTGQNGSLDTREYSQACKSKNSTILGFYWNTCTEIIFLTTHGIEMYNVLSDKRQVKSVRHQSHPITWFTFCTRSAILVTSSGLVSSCLQPFFFRSGNIFKLSKVDLISGIEKVEAREKDVSVVSLYESQMYIMVIVHKEDSEPVSQQTDIHLYSVSKDTSTVTRAHILRAPFAGSGGLAANVVDNVLVLHHRGSGTSSLFDIALGGEFDGSIAYHRPLGSPVRVKPAKGVSSSPGDEYSPNWVMFMPNVVIDAKQGIMWRLRLRMKSSNKKDPVVSSTELPRLVGFLLQREGAKMVLLDALLEWCSDSKTDLATIGAAFARINREYRLYLDTQLAPSLALPASSAFVQSASAQGALVSSATATVSVQPSKVVLDQADLYTNLLSPLFERATVHDTVSLKRVTAVVLEYARSLEERQIPAQHFLHELLINLLVRNDQWYQLHQMLQYHVMGDSKPLACLLLSLESAYPASFQLALDMLARLRNSGEEITEILLSKGKVFSALRYASANGLEATIPAREFLEAAKESRDDQVFFHTYNWLDERNLLQQRGCGEFKKHYQIVIGSGA